MIAISFFTLAIITVFALVGFAVSVRALLDVKSKTKRQFEKYKSFYNNSPKGMKRNLLSDFNEADLYN